MTQVIPDRSLQGQIVQWEQKILDVKSAAIRKKKLIMYDLPAPTAKKK